MFGGFELLVVWWVLLGLFWVVLIGLIVFLAVRLGRPADDTVGAPTGGAAGAHEPPEAILDRMFALGQIDEDTYRSRRTALAQMRGQP